jgi:hypothetical protein
MSSDTVWIINFDSIIASVARDEQVSGFSLHGQQVENCAKERRGCYVVMGRKVGKKPRTRDFVARCHTKVSKRKSRN